ncbi:nicolin-1-like [Melanaphis sacchari]|uniref:nicolin-1-like n=1 Tax=Melanaphis sacchari TaxID=742174 RepID=UPI000DC14715|nr:nicolin-1-like [Melanaphis sacchari]
MENYIYELNSNLCIQSSSAENSHNSIEFGATVIPIYLNINDQKNPGYNSKCIAMILDFGSTSQDVGEIYFKNYYTYIISVLVMKTSNTDPKRLKKWYIAIKQKKIMDNTHSELQSQDYVCIESSESEIDWSDLYKIKLILRQPSPNWSHFGIDDVKVVRKV